MSEHHEGDGWWIASDGNWYPPELHPSVKGDPTNQMQSAGSVGASEEHQVGPQFPDLFQKALEGNHLADNVSVKYDGEDQRNVPVPATSSASRHGAPSPTSARNPAAAASGGPVGDFTGATASKRSRWRRH